MTDARVAPHAADSRRDLRYRKALERETPHEEEEPRTKPEVLPERWEGVAAHRVLSKLRVKQLREACRMHDLHVSGLKHVLIRRLIMSGQILREDQAEQALKLIVAKRLRKQHLPEMAVKDVISPEAAQLWIDSMALCDS